MDFGPRGERTASDGVGGRLRLRPEPVNDGLRQLSRPTEKTGATVLTLPESPGGVPGTDDYFSFMDYIVKQMATALKKDANG